MLMIQSVIRKSSESNHNVIKWSSEIQSLEPFMELLLKMTVNKWKILVRTYCCPFVWQSARKPVWQKSSNFCKYFSKSQNCYEMTYFWLVEIFVEGWNFRRTGFPGRQLYESMISLKLKVLGINIILHFHIPPHSPITNA